LTRREFRRELEKAVNKSTEQELRALLDKRNREIIRLTGVINQAIDTLKRGDPHEAQLQLIAANLQTNADEEWAPDRGS
jgi:hypothetical protein